MSLPVSEPVLGVIGGSGLYDIDGLQKVREETIQSPFGAPSDDLIFGELNGQRIVFLARHGRGHNISPSHINYRANIDALKRAGCTEILSVSAVGSLREDLAPGTFVIVDQFIDRTFAREKTFFGDGVVAHVSMADPVCSRMGDLIEKAGERISSRLVRGGTYLVMEGPQFSTRAESKLYRSWECDIIGMTNMPEAKLAREAELCYASIGMVTDYDCWHSGHEDVTVETVIAVLQQNALNAKDLLRALAPMISGRTKTCPAGCHQALDTAIITAPHARDANTLKNLDAVAGRLFSE
ncbi:MAG: S-methyl-5'-thioadenosine phosphorylase [Rhodospirillaceae bacterium]